ncbi:MAG: hypothetical protein CMC15_14735 [Flavobacteriaceae bacterium]|nr:hypothetical protein [Flavobacteriaceae bacterium]
MKTGNQKLLRSISPMEVLKISQGHFAVCTWLVGKCMPDLTCSQSQSMAHGLEATILSWGVVDLEGARTELRKALKL